MTRSGPCPHCALDPPDHLLHCPIALLNRAIRVEERARYLEEQIARLAALSHTVPCGDYRVKFDVGEELVSFSAVRHDSPDAHPLLWGHHHAGGTSYTTDDVIAPGDYDTIRDLLHFIHEHIRHLP